MWKNVLKIKKKVEQSKKVKISKNFGKIEKC